jgi:hypothetical protein
VSTMNLLTMKRPRLAWAWANCPRPRANYFWLRWARTNMRAGRVSPTSSLSTYRYFHLPQRGISNIARAAVREEKGGHDG